MKPTLEQNILSLQTGERRALAAIYEETKRAVFSVAVGILKASADAEDVMQDTYVKVCESVGTYREGGNAKAWVCTIARNCALDKLRRDRRSAPLEAAENVAAAEPDTDDRLDGAALIARAKAILSPQEFEIVYMHAVGDLSHAEIAKTVGRPYATVRWIYASAIGKLKKAFAE